MISHGSQKITSLRRGTWRITSMTRGTFAIFGYLASPYSKAATIALQAAFPNDWETIAAYGFAHPEIVPIVNEYPYYAAARALYHCVEYIQSTGSQYLATNYLLDNTDTIETDIVLVVNSACVTWGTRNFNIFWVGSSGYYNWGTMGYSNLYRSYLSQTEFRNVKENQVGVYVDDVLRASFSGTQSITKDTYGLWIFRGNSVVGEMSGYNSCGIKMKEYKVRKLDNSLGLWLMPCYDDNNTIGMYDVITNTFYTNAGTGTFLKGSDIYYPGQSPS